MAICTSTKKVAKRILEGITICVAVGPKLWPLIWVRIPTAHFKHSYLFTRVVMSNSFAARRGLMLPCKRPHHPAGLHIALPAMSATHKCVHDSISLADANLICLARGRVHLCLTHIFLISGLDTIKDNNVSWC